MRLTLARASLMTLTTLFALTAVALTGGSLFWGCVIITATNIGVMYATSRDD